MIGQLTQLLITNHQSPITNHLFTYLLKRILLFIPTLVLVSLLAFGLSRLAPGDPVSQYLGEDAFGKYSTPNDLLAAERGYAQAAADLHLDKPAFYFSITSQAYPDTLYRIFPPTRRLRLTRLAAQVDNWPLVSAYEQRLTTALCQVDRVSDSLPQKTQLRRAMSDLLLIERIEFLDTARQYVRHAVAALPENQVFLKTPDSLDASVSALQAAAQNTNFPRPAIYWYGLDNQ